MIILGILFINFGEHFILKIYGNDSHDLFKNLTFYLFAFSTLGLMNNSLTVLNNIGMAHYSNRILLIFLIPYFFAIYYLPELIKVDYIVIDMICFLFLFFIFSTTVHFKIKTYTPQMKI
jgi:hypothetical protein